MFNTIGSLASILGLFFTIWLFIIGKSIRDDLVNRAKIKLYTVYDVKSKEIYDKLDSNKLSLNTDITIFADDLQTFVKIAQDLQGTMKLPEIDDLIKKISDKIIEIRGTKKPTQAYKTEIRNILLTVISIDSTFKNQLRNSLYN